MPDQADERSECPPSHVWDEIATGSLLGDQAFDLLEHAAGCAGCAQLLRESLAVFAPEASIAPEERPAPESKARPGKPRPIQRSWLAAAAVLAVALVPAAWWWLSRTSPKQVERQLAAAYTASRMMEVRWPGARHGPYSVARGVAGVPSPELLAAQQTIREGLSQHPDDLNWQLAICQLRILSGEFTAAIDELQRLRSFGADRKRIDESLAIAYFQRGETDGRRSDYESADRIWAELLSVDPDDSTALFNAALTKQRLEQPDRAIPLLERLIQVEQDPGWRQEAARRLEELRGPMRGQQQSP